MGNSLYHQPVVALTLTWLLTIGGSKVAHADKAVIVGSTPAVQASASQKSSLASSIDEFDLSEKQKAKLATLPPTVEEQRRELLRLARIPLPTYDERERFSALMGWGFPKQPRHPLQDNKIFLIDHYRSQGRPTQSEIDELITSLKKRMIHLKGGKFMMGDFGPLVFKDKLTLTGNRDSGPAHEVGLDGYAIMKGRVTFGEYDLYLRSLGKDLLPEGESIHPRRPGYVATGVNWADADGYCKWLRGLTGKPFALPTEAQWEYAAREGGKLIAYPMHNWPNLKWQNKYQPDFQSKDHSVDAILPKIQAKAGKPSTLIDPRPPNLNGENRIGMQDVVSSESAEWVADWYQADYYSISPKRNPRGPEHGTERVAREGSYSLFNTILGRHGVPPERGQGFRCVLNEVKPWK